MRKPNAAIFVASGQGATAVIAPMSSSEKIVQSINFVKGGMMVVYLISLLLFV